MCNCSIYHFTTKKEFHHSSQKTHSLHCPQEMRYLYTINKLLLPHLFGFILWVLVFLCDTTWHYACKMVIINKLQDKYVNNQNYNQVWHNEGGLLTSTAAQGTESLNLQIITDFKFLISLQVTQKKSTIKLPFWNWLTAL